VRRKWKKTDKFSKPLETDSGSRRRPSYFRHFRVERRQLSILENTFSRTYDRKEYRANRYLYYFVLPRLMAHLSYGPDRDRLLNVEHDLYNQILSYHFVQADRFLYLKYKGGPIGPNKKRRPLHEPNRLVPWQTNSGTLLRSSE